MSIELETRMAHYERQFEDLSGVVAEQARTIDVLTREIRRLSERISDLEYELQRPGDVKPPHY